MNFLKLPIHNVWFFEKGFLRASVGEVHYEFRLKQTRPELICARFWRDGFPVMNFSTPPLSEGMASNMALYSCLP